MDCTNCCITHTKERGGHLIIKLCPLHAAAPELLEALTQLYKETADYIQINNLGDTHHNKSMQDAKAAIAKAEGK